MPALLRAAPPPPAGGRVEGGGGAAPPAPPPGPGDLVATPAGARFLGQSFPCAIGAGGLVPAAEKREGDGASPLGAWPLTGGWWRADRLSRPDTCLPLRPAGPADGWSDDPDDPNYNAAVRLPHPFSTESLRRADPLYDIVITTGHNRPAVPGRGSAIFLHCWRAPRRATAGCVALSRPRLLWVLANLRPGARLVICRSIFSVTRETLIVPPVKQATTGDAP